jgi:uncharacterized tellurite resistance protein B-like protein
MERDARVLIAQLAVAVMVADARMTSSERAAAEQLNGWGLGSLSGLVEREIQRAMLQPINVRAVCAALAPMGPDACSVILTALAEIAASDREVSEAELSMLNIIGNLLGLDAADTNQILQTAIAGSGARIVANMADAGAAARTNGDLECGWSADYNGADCDSSIGDSYRLLALQPGADAAQLNDALLRTVERYNPAKFADLGPEFVALAVRKLGETTAAFELLRDKVIKA